MLDITPAGMRLLQLLVEAAPSVVVRDELETLLWADDRPDGDALRSHMYKLRQIVDWPFAACVAVLSVMWGFAFLQPSNSAKIG